MNILVFFLPLFKNVLTHLILSQWSLEAPCGEYSGEGRPSDASLPVEGVLPQSHT